MEDAWWRLVCLLRSAVPAPQVIDCLKRLPAPPDDGVGVPCEDVEPGPLGERVQRAFLALLQHDPVLSLLGLRPHYQRSLLKRLLTEVEAEGLTVADELADAYAAVLTCAPGHVGAEGPRGADTEWLFKTFAYGRAAPSSSSSSSSSGTGTGAGSGQRLSPAPLPREVTERHMRCLAAALAESRRAAEPQGGDTNVCDHGANGASAHAEAASIVGPLPRGAASDMAGADTDRRGDGASPTAPGELCCVNHGAAACGPCGPCGLVTLRVSANLLAGSTGCHEWEASFALAQWLLSHPERVAGRRVLELGCGAGLVAVALRRAGAALVAATDGSGDAACNAAANLRLNGLECPVAECGGAQELAAMREGVAVCVLAWEEPLPAGGLGFDTVVASDVLYDPEVVPVLVGLLARLLGDRTAGTELGLGTAPPGTGLPPGGAGACEAYVATLRRNPATLELFLRTAAARGLAVEEVKGWQGAGAGGGDGGGGGGVVFHHLPALEEASTAERLVLHRITAPPAMTEPGSSNSEG